MTDCRVKILPKTAEAAKKICPHLSGGIRFFAQKTFLD